jgi:hypothetical protein
MIFSTVTFSNFWSSKPYIWIRIRIDKKCWIRIRTDTNPDTQHCLKQQKTSKIFTRAVRNELSRVFRMGWAAWALLAAWATCDMGATCGMGATWPFS